MRHPLEIAVLAALSALAAVPAAAQQPDATALYVKSLAATCATCHGTNGRAVEASAVPGLAGMNATYFSEQMKAFKSGARAATVMHQLAKGYNDAQIDALAGYFAAQPR